LPDILPAIVWLPTPVFLGSPPQTVNERAESRAHERVKYHHRERRQRLKNLPSRDGLVWHQEFLFRMTKHYAKSVSLNPLEPRKPGDAKFFICFDHAYILDERDTCPYRKLDSDIPKVGTTKHRRSFDMPVALNGCAF